MKKEFTSDFHVRYQPIKTASERARYNRAMTLLAGLFAEALDEIYEMDAAEKLKEIQEGDANHADNTTPCHPDNESKNNQSFPGQTSR